MQKEQFDTKPVELNDVDLNDRVESEELDHESINLVKNSDSCREMPRIDFKMYEDIEYDEMNA